MNLPNKLTMLRICFIPFFVFFILAEFVPYNDFIALGVFAIASLTDLFDGKIARKRGLVTNFGKFMDPLADKLLVVTALMCLLIVDGGERMCSMQILGLIAVLVVVAREFIISGFRLVACDKGVVLAASMWGKAKTAVTMVAICLMIVVKRFAFLKSVTMVVFWVAVTLTVVSLVDYLAKNISVLKDEVEVKPENGELEAATETGEANTPDVDSVASEDLKESVCAANGDVENNEQ